MMYLLFKAPNLTGGMGDSPVGGCDMTPILPHCVDFSRRMPTVMWSAIGRSAANCAYE
jgi:hypothetical protein